MFSWALRHVITGSLAAGASRLVAGAIRLPRAAAADAAPAADHMAHERGGTQGLIPGPSPWESADLVESEERRAVGGMLATDLHARYTWKESSGY